MYQARGDTRLARQLVNIAFVVDVLLLFVTACTFATTNWSVVDVFALLVSVAVGCYAWRAGLPFEWLLERKFKAVCNGVGMKAVSTSYRYGLVGAARGDTKIIYPKLRRVCGDRDAWTGYISPFLGHDLDTYIKHTAAYALAFYAPFVLFDIAENGLIRMRVGSVQVPATYDHEAQLNFQVAQVDRGVIQADEWYMPPIGSQSKPRLLLDDRLAVLKAVPMALDINGRSWTMPIEGQHVLVAGRTGSGKGSWVWTLVLGIAPAIDAGYCRIWALDPKRVELALGRRFFHKYADTMDGMVVLIEEFLVEMQARGDAMQGVVRKFTPSIETPLNVLFIDELAYITTLLPDKKLKDRGMQALTTILTQGRAMGYSVVGVIQDPRKETLPNRDSFPIRVALGLAEKQIVDMVLGAGAYDAGATCDKIPLFDAGAGVGFVISETNVKPLCVRAPWVSDEVIRGGPLLNGGQTRLLQASTSVVQQKEMVLDAD